MEQVNIPEEAHKQAADDAAVTVDAMLDQGREPLVIGLAGAIMFATASKATGLDSFEYEAADGHTVKITVEHEGENDA